MKAAEAALAVARDNNEARLAERAMIERGLDERQKAQRAHEITMHKLRCLPDSTCPIGQKERCSMAAYSTALAGESVHDDLKANWDAESKVFNRVTHDDLERFARTVAYKVAKNLKNGHEMDPDMNPLDK